MVLMCPAGLELITLVFCLQLSLVARAIPANGISSLHSLGPWGNCRQASGCLEQ